MSEKLTGTPMVRAAYPVASMKTARMATADWWPMRIGVLPPTEPESGAHPSRIAPPARASEPTSMVLLLIVTNVPRSSALPGDRGLRGSATMTLPELAEQLLLVQRLRSKRPRHPRQVHEMAGIDVLRGYVGPPGSAAQHARERQTAARTAGPVAASMFIHDPDPPVAHPYSTAIPPPP